MPGQAAQCWAYEQLEGCGGCCRIAGEPVARFAAGVVAVDQLLFAGQFQVVGEPGMQRSPRPVRRIWLSIAPEPPSCRVTEVPVRCSNARGLFERRLCGRAGEDHERFRPVAGQGRHGGQQGEQQPGQGAGHGVQSPRKHSAK